MSLEFHALGSAGVCRLTKFVSALNYIHMNLVSLSTEYGSVRMFCLVSTHPTDVQSVSERASVVAVPVSPSLHPEQ